MAPLAAPQTFLLLHNAEGWRGAEYILTNMAAFRALIRARCSLLFSTLAIKMKIQNMTKRLECVPVRVPVSGVRAQI